MSLRRLGIVACLLAVACGTSAVDPVTIPPGSWGSVSAGMTVTATGATVVFCCSGGTISGPLIVGSNGGFSFPGTFASLGGPQVSATYSGVLIGNTMNLAVSAPPYSPESATLTYGRQETDICFCPRAGASTP
jgi:hypothetical protein